MTKVLAREQFPWWDVRIFQADERVAPLGSPECTLTYLNQEFLSSLPPPPDHVRPMPVDDPDLATAARHYQMLLQRIAGTAAVNRLRAALLKDYVVLGGGNAKELKTLPSGTRLGDNANVFSGGFHVWQEHAACGGDG
jgi:6-phosphogluconolactonase/glucosamine-6-phosphate isomerase/deaminase